MLNVMLIDDEEHVLTGLRCLIDWEKQNARICGAFQFPQEALAAAPILCPDLIITDIEMPDLSGLDLIAALQEHVPGCTCAILSAYDDFHYAQQAVKLGVFRYLLKPLDPEDLASLLEEVAQKHLRDANEGDEQFFIRSFVIQEIILNDAKIPYSQKLPYYQDLYQSKKLQLALLSRTESDASAHISLELLQKEFLPKLHPFAAFQGEDYFLFLLDSDSVPTVLEDFHQKNAGDYTLQFSAPFQGLSAGHTIYRSTIQKPSIESEDSLLANVTLTQNQLAVQRAKAYIQTHYMEADFKLTNISDSLYMNYSYLSQIFKKETGNTLFNYLLDLRMEKARNLLLRSGLSVAEIGRRVGYPLPKNFHSAFQKYYHMSPKKYQQQYFQKQTPESRI